MLRVQHSLKSKEFFVKLATGNKAYLQYQELPGKILDFQHTFTPDEGRGKGLAKLLVSEGFKYAAENKFKVEPTCTYVLKYVNEMASEEEKQLSTTYQSSL
ncbi:unnamed protein product [Auanema sp. JU1783]|nr:unnamed protein product [Auanema sp. JU1783]